MRNFKLIAKAVVTEPLRVEVEERALWNWLNLRKLFPGSCHREAEDVVLRFAPVDRPASAATIFNDLETVSYLAWFAHPRLRALIERIVPVASLGRAMVVKLPPGGRIYPHRDEGRYAEAHDRYHLVLQGACRFRSGEEWVEMKTGELWWFDQHQEHEVRNEADVDRISVIWDVRR
jgi:quercetin dioxygenase-like cupin family protein